MKELEGSIMNQAKQNIIEQQRMQVNTAFPFLSGVLALDLVNTDILLRGKRHDFLTSPEDAASWWRQANLHHPNRDRVQREEETTQWDIALLEALKRLRVALRHVFLSLIERRPVDASGLEELNRVLALGSRSLELNQAGELVPVYQTVEPQRGAVLLPIAVSALRLITEAERERLHECANERCIGLFYDTTRSATRHWCSSECMNRARSLQRYRRAKAEKAATISE
jgi:predicted RNA-binding Zn ribbon-like protein